jgi:TOMM system kinase/cyclase fusion protein
VADSDERRPLAVLFCDIVGSTNHLRKLGPEDWLSILRDFHESTSRVVLQFGGYVAQHLGDGMLVYFGFPQAHDDDPRRAVEAGLEIITALSSLNTRLLYSGWPELRLRIGIATGRTLVGSVKSGSETLAHGETPHLAARLQNMAEPNTVLMDQATYDLVKGFFRCEEVTGTTARDFPQTHLYVVRGRTEERTRLDVSTKRGRLSSFVGRSAELTALNAAWTEVLSGERRSLLIKGEPGLGKTRLVQTFGRALDGADHILECRASPYRQNRALHPIVEMLERILELQSGEDNESKLRKLESWLSGSSALGLSSLPVFAPLFSLTLPEERTIPDLSPSKLRQLAFELLVKWFDFLGKRGTVLLLIEDVHWADPSTLELLGHLVAGQPGSRLLLLFTARPEFSNPWRDACPTLELERLSDTDTEMIVTSLAPNLSVARDFLRVVLGKAEGVPLFAEELTRTLIETGALTAEGDPTTATGSVPSLPEIPSTLTGLLMARLDRLGPAKRTAQLAATIGREFRRDLLTEVSSVDPEALSTDIQHLVDEGLVHPAGLSKEAYAFKHALIRDAAYELMSSHARGNAHERIAAAFERRFPDVVNNQPDLVAYHYAAAGQRRRALVFAQRAAEQALKRSAYVEAIAHASNAKTWSADLNESERAEAELGANGLLSQSIMMTRGWADPEVKALADRSAALLHDLAPRSPHRVPTLWSLFAYHHTASNRRAARTAAEDLVGVAEGTGDPGFRAAAAAILGITLHPEGNISAARRTLETAIRLYDPELHRNQGAKIGLDSLVLSKALLAHLIWFEGDSGAAFGLVREAVEWARATGHIPSTAIGLLYGCQVYQFAGDRAAAGEMTGEILALSKQYGLPAYEGYAAIIHAWATRNEPMAEGVLSGLKMMGCNLCLSYYGSLVAENMADRGALDAAIARMDECLALCATNDEHYYEPELHRKRALYELQKGGDRDSARASLERAAALARRQEMPRLEWLAGQELSKSFGSDSFKERMAQLGKLYPTLNH